MTELAYIAPEMADDFEESVRLGVEAGARSVALRSRLWGKNLEDLSAADVDRMKAILAQHGASVSAVYSAVGKCSVEDPQEVARNVASLPRMIELAHTFGTDLIRVFPFQRKGVVEYEPSRLDEHLDLVVDRCAPLVRRAEAEGVVLCLEAVGSTLARTAQELRHVLQALGDSPAAGIVWEIDVAWRAGEPPRQGYGYARGITRDVHVKPNPELPLAGAGETYETAIRALLADGYQGPLTVEHWRGADNTMSALRQLGALLARL
ncbi:MAG: sugar phosphate isomerase/epimerase [Anaerolineae bacterium]|nr:sugar phosphate isomerase/epimerase [Anaerolineae bacterium]